MHNTAINLTGHQQAAISACYASLNEYTEVTLKDGTPYTVRMAVLSGAGGVGKTTCAAEIARRWKGEELLGNKNIYFAAPTHKAKQQLQESIGKDYEATTFASLSGNTIKKSISLDPENSDEKSVSVSRGHKLNSISRTALVVVDEVSMLSKNNLKQLLDAAERRGFAVLMMGDYYQLPPVGKNEFSIFECDNINMVALTENHRQENMQLLDALTSMRRCITKGEKINIDDYAFPSYLEADTHNNTTVGYIKSNVLSETIPLYAVGDTIVLDQPTEHYNNADEVVIDSIKSVRIDNYRFYNINNGSLWVHRYNNAAAQRFMKTLKHKLRGEYNNETDYTEHLKKCEKAEKMLVNTVLAFNAKGINVHKAQGSTYDNVILLKDDFEYMIGKGHLDTDTYNRAIYTACSRAKHNVFVKTKAAA